MKKPNGRPRALSPEQEQYVYAVITASPRRDRHLIYARVAGELSVSISTVERAVRRQRKQHLAAIAASIHVERQNPLHHNSKGEPE